MTIYHYLPNAKYTQIGLIMKKQTTDEIITFLKENIEPLTDNIYGNRYRASVYLVDGTYLPCVIFQNSENLTQLALKRFEDERNRKTLFGPNPHEYKEIVKHFVTSGNRINEFDIAKVEISKYAFPVDILKQIKGETTMGWTGFSAKMKDGKYVGFGTSFLMEFFELPDNYTADDIVEIINHSYVLPDGTLCEHKLPFFANLNDNYKTAVINKSRPFFECYLEDL